MRMEKELEIINILKSVANKLSELDKKHAEANKCSMKKK